MRKETHNQLTVSFYCQFLEHWFLCHWREGSSSFRPPWRQLVGPNMLQDKEPQDVKRWQGMLFEDLNSWVQMIQAGTWLTTWMSRKITRRCLRTTRSESPWHSASTLTWVCIGGYSVWVKENFTEWVNLNNCVWIVGPWHAFYNVQHWHWYDA